MKSSFSVVVLSVSVDWLIAEMVWFKFDKSGLVCVECSCWWHGQWQGPCGGVDVDVVVGGELEEVVLDKGE